MKKLKKLIKLIIFLIIVIVIGITAYETNKGYNMYKSALNDMSLSEKQEKIREKEHYTKINEVPKTYINAILAVEDHRFYKHNGVDIISIGRAVFKDIRRMKLIEGGSTITQQLAKNIYFTQEKKLTRKIAEVFMATEMEKNYSKDDILELYINTSYFGDGYYCVKDAANGYFKKEPIDMNDYESIMLAGIPNAPSVYAPTQNLNLAKQRQKQVADAMVKWGYLTKEEANEILGSENK